MIFSLLRVNSHSLNDNSLSAVNLNLQAFGIRYFYHLKNASEKVSKSCWKLAKVTVSFPLNSNFDTAAKELCRLMDDAFVLVVG